MVKNVLNDLFVEPLGEVNHDTHDKPDEADAYQDKQNHDPDGPNG